MTTDSVFDEAEERPTTAGDTGEREESLPGFDPVDDAGDASFPASDPPSWWSGE